MNAQHSKDPLHGVTLEMQINHLVARYGWSELGKRININCFKSDPSVKSSLKFLRRTPWARAEVEALYLASLTAKPESREAPDALPDDDPWGNWRGNTPE
ncbi:VF530 family DNA-binding protein [Pantoea sp. C2G6]|uniref:VF530 family protein n=1 Tax=Pantoea sp. C2G6 TaxID=3243084 RepID=UPI003ED8853B